MKKFDEGTYEVILFRANDRLMAIEIPYLVEIVEAVPVSPLPFVPAYVQGLVNVNGKIMPQVDLANLVFGASIEANTDGASQSGKSSVIGKTLLIVNVDGVPIALKIDQVRESFSLQGSSIRQAAIAAEPSKPEEPVRAMETKGKKGSRKGGRTENPAAEVPAVSVPVPAMPSYVSGEFDFLGETAVFFDAESLKDVVKSTAKPVGKQGFLGKVTETKTETEQFNEYLISEAAGKEFAVDLDEVNEIVIMEGIRPLPRAPELVVGMGLVRGEPRLMLSMAALLEEPREERITTGAAIMVRFGDILCGIVADRMVGLETVSTSNQRQNREKTALTILREDGHTLTRVIRFSALFNDKVMGQIRPYLPIIRSEAGQVAVKQVEMLRFKLDGVGYALKLKDVHRVVSGKYIEPLLSEKGYLMGTMELEGKVVPVINLINQLGYAQSNIPVVEYIVVNEGGREWGLAIGETDQIIQVEEPKIDDVKSQDARYVAAYSNYEDDLLTILNVRAICHDNHYAGAA